MIKRKIKHIVLIVLILFTGCSYGYAIKFQRICVKGDDVILMYYNVTDTCNKFISLIIYARENNFDVFKPIDTIYNPSINDYIHLKAVNKSTNWSYFIKLQRNCAGNDSVFSDTMSIDLTKPNNVQLDSVTVKNSKTEMGWKAATSPDTKGYIIYYKDINGNIGIIDTVYGKNNTFYRDNGFRDPDKRIEKYMIAAFDSCDNLTPISKEHNTILHFSEQDTCKAEITLIWNKYSNWTDPQTEYSIYFSKNGGPFVLAHKMSNTNSNYTFSGLENKMPYCFFVRAFNKDSNFSSTSNITCLTTNFTEKPSFVYLKNVTVINNQIEISWAVDNPNNIKEFRIYREEGNQSFSLFQTFNNTVFSTIDNTANINTTKYRYYVEETDICNNPPLRSNEGGNILLESVKIDLYYQLKWNIYYLWAGGLKKQTLFNKKEDDVLWNYFDNPANTEETYIKHLLVSDLKGNDVCFYIENEEGDTNKYGYKETSVSNIVCISGGPIVFMPNAFYPKGLYNRFFKPIGKNIDTTKTEINIYNRWGQLIWNSSGISDGWGGRNNKNQEMPEGVYYYFITIFGKDKSKIELSGNVTLLK